MTGSNRRRALMAALEGGDSFPLYLYNEGVISPVVGDFNTDGYKYATQFSQSKQPDYLYITATSLYNIPGGRTWSGNIPISAKYIGKTLKCSGVVGVTGDVAGGRSYVFLYLSDSVTNDSSNISPLDSTAFENESHVSFYTGELTAGQSKTFTLSLPITKDGYVSVVMFKNYNGKMYTMFQKIWIE